MHSDFHNADVQGGGESHFNLRDPNVIQPKTKNPTDLDHYFLEKKNIQQQKKTGFEGPTTGSVLALKLHTQWQRWSSLDYAHLLKHIEILRISDRLAQYGFAFLRGVSSGAFGFGRHSEHIDTVLFTKPCIRSLLIFREIWNKHFKKAQSFDFPGVFFCVGRPIKPGQPSQHEKVGSRSGDWTLLICL